MKVQYDPAADAMYIRLADGTVADSDEVLAQLRAIRGGRLALTPDLS